ncbi:MAG: 4a-hydroxytetrahydrobiopterin dehydratase [Halobacteriota archaeon]
MAELLPDEELAKRLPKGWEREGDEIVKTYEFDEYLDGVTFATRVGEIAEMEFHHPEIVVRYGSVELRLTNHEAGGITDRDIDLAELFDEAY